MIIDSSDDEDFECTKETTPEIHDIDGGNDIFLVTEYASEIYQYLKQAEVFIFCFILCPASQIVIFIRDVLSLYGVFNSMCALQNGMHDQCNLQYSCKYIAVVEKMAIETFDNQLRHYVFWSFLSFLK